MARVVHIMKRLKRGGPQKLGELYADSRGRSEIVATFLAVLELVKSHRIRVDGAQGGETVDIVRGER
jgi:segregation and condensation protein A